MDKDYVITTTFDVDGDKNQMVAGYAKTHPRVPQSKPYYFNPSALANIIAWWNGYGGQSFVEGLYLWGPTGSGKTSLWEQYAARLNIPTHSVTGHGSLELQDFMGERTLIDGDVIWQDGPLTSAYRHGHVFLLNEVDAVRPDVLVGLNSILEGGALVLTQNGGENVLPAQGFRAVFTANTAGSGDMTGIYQGTLRMNGAFRDRNTFLYVGYTPPETERKIMNTVLPHIPEEVRDTYFGQMIKVANHIRERYEGKSGDTPLDITFSTRSLIRWAQIMWYHRSLPKDKGDVLHYALDIALGNSTDEITRTALHEITQKIIG